MIAELGRCFDHLINMQILVASTFRDDRSSVTAQDQRVPASLSSWVGFNRTPANSWSSVGDISSEEEEEEDDDAVSSSQGRWFDSFTSSLEDSLPIKRGLSNHYIGKSKSFENLMEAASSSAKDLEKLESPLNKRRRLLIANKLRRRSSFSIYSNINPNHSMPLLALQESDLEDIHKYNDINHTSDDDDDDETSSKLKEKRMKMTNNNHHSRDLMVHQSKSCFSLTSFQDDDGR
ncbi:hypothetical protein CARUB_v10005647mg [Capsella rubella]|uniref:Uncharacterized protein n=1 Tax=Capsella rubella TaxID=81985 RepID=R0GKH8_9BRAS|nr:uncharacterized protein LOC17878953 [Capsella rubella]EOA17364.1 hypothetical protein CARUB_v10005647mg [Capsella rubella]